MKKIMLVAVLCVLGFALLGQAQGKLFLRIDHGDVALEIGGTEEAGGISGDPNVRIALFSNQFGEFTNNVWVLVGGKWGDLVDFRDLKDSLSRYLATSNKALFCIYPSDFYNPDEMFQVLALGDSVLIRGICEDDDHFIAIKISLDEAQELVDALSVALTLAKKP